MEAVHLSQLPCPGCGKGIPEGGITLYCEECSTCLFKGGGFYDLLKKDNKASGRFFWDLRAHLYEKMLPVTMALGNGSFSYHQAVEEVAEIALQGVPPGYPFLDVATGTGLVLKNLLKKDKNQLYVGLDYSLNMLNLARENLKATNGILLIRGDAHQLPFTSTFGSITCAAALGNMKDPDQVVQEMARVTVKGGKLTLLLTLMEDDARWNLRLWKRLMDGLYQMGQVPLRWFSPKEVIETLERANYCDIHLKSLGGTWQIISGRLA